MDPETILNLQSPEFQERVAVFVLVLTRMSGLFIIAPFFRGPSTPQRLKLLLALGLTVCVAPQLRGQGPEALAVLSQPVSATIALAAELTIGAAVGFLVALIVGAVQTAGYLISLDMGMTIANVLDPVSNLQTSILGQLKSSFAVLVMLLLDIHHHLIRVLTESFRWLPFGWLGRVGVESAVGAHLQEIAEEQGDLLFSTAVHMALPVTVTLLLVTVAMAFLARTVPEMNIFMLGFALRILIGFWVVVLLFPFLEELYRDLFHDMIVNAASYLQRIAGWTL